MVSYRSYQGNKFVNFSICDQFWSRLYLVIATDKIIDQFQSNIGTD